MVAFIAQSVALNSILESNLGINIFYFPEEILSTAFYVVLLPFILTYGAFHDILSSSWKKIYLLSYYRSIYASAGPGEQFMLLMGLMPNLLRVILAFTFLFSFFLQPAKGVILTAWARVVESDKPVFTLVFGGVAGIAKAIEELVKSAL